MKVRSTKGVFVAVIAAIGVLSGTMAGSAQGQADYGAGGPAVPGRPGDPGWGARPSHPVDPGNSDGPRPGGPVRPDWRQWRHPLDGRDQRGPAYESGWFQRPYPYHLDYYRMRYGGSYAPYFGNISGPPIIYRPRYGFGPMAPGWGGAFYW
jgi:hypothetical protein